MTSDVTARSRPRSPEPGTRTGRPRRARGYGLRIKAIRHPTIVIPRSYRRASDRFGVRATLPVILCLIAAVAALPVIVRAGGLAAALMMLPVLGALAVKVVMLLEECSRATLFRTAWVNDAVGHLCGGLVGLSFSAVSGRGGLRARPGMHRHCPTEVRGRMLFLLEPLTALTLLRHLGRTDGLPARVWRPRMPDGGHDPRVWRELAVLLTVQAAIALVASGFGERWWLALAYPVSAATFGVFFDRARWFCERSMPASPAIVGRSHAANTVDRLLFYTLNRHLYVESSLFPSIPACHLPLVHRDLARAGYFTQEMVAASMLGTLLRGLTPLRRGPAHRP